MKFVYYYNERLKWLKELNLNRRGNRMQTENKMLNWWSDMDMRNYSDK